MPLKNFKTTIIQICLFIATLATTTLAGVDWIGLRGDSFLQTYAHGLWFSIPFLGILTFHEFGHYLTAKYYQLKVSLPYYIPIYIPYVPSIGTLGAFIKINSVMPSKKVVFDVGIAGPLAGFVVAMCLLWYGFTHLPEPEYIYKIRPSYEQFGLDYEKSVYSYAQLRAEDSINSAKYKIEFTPKAQYEVMSTGTNLMFYFFENYVAPDGAWIPNRFEMFHYPFLFAGFLALFFTALNLLPIGQLDGGHILYGLVGKKWQRRSAPFLFAAFAYLGTLDFLKETFDLRPMQSMDDMVSFAPLYLLFLTLMFSSVSTRLATNVMIAVVVFAAQYFTLYFFPQANGFNGWWVFAFILGRFLGIYHPPCPDETPLNWQRKVLGYCALVIFILCFSPQPIVIELIGK